MGILAMDFERILGVPFFHSSSHSIMMCLPTLDILWGQTIKVALVASNSELRENQKHEFLFFVIVPCHFCGASEVET